MCKTLILDCDHDYTIRAEDNGMNKMLYITCKEGCYVMTIRKEFLDDSNRYFISVGYPSAPFEPVFESHCTEEVYEKYFDMARAMENNE